MELVTSVALATVILEGIKQLVYKIKPGLVFPMVFYYFMLPILTFAVEPFLSFIGFTNYVLPTDWQGWVMELIRIAITSLLSVALYENSIGRIKIAKERKQLLG